MYNWVALLCWFRAASVAGASTSAGGATGGFVHGETGALVWFKQNLFGLGL